MEKNLKALDGVLTIILFVSLLLAIWGNFYFWIKVFVSCIVLLILTSAIMVAVRKTKKKDGPTITKNENKFQKRIKEMMEEHEKKN